MISKTNKQIIGCSTIIVVLLVIVVVFIYMSCKQRNYPVTINITNWDVHLTPKPIADQVKLPMNTTYFRNKRVVICGLLRHKEDQVKYLRKRIEQWTSLFQDWAIVIVENDSKDRTRQYLLEWQAEYPNNVFILGCGLNAKKCELKLPPTLLHNKSETRINKMVVLREEYRKFVKQHPILSKYEFLITTDLDLKGYTYLDGLWNTAYHFEKNPTIDGIAANGIAISAQYDNKSVLTYQDPFAHEDESDNYNHLRHFWTGKPFGSDLIKVKSAFGGFTMYRTKSFINSCYRLEMQSNNKEAYCEHVTLHRQMNGVYLNPNLLHIIVDNTDGFESDYSSNTIKKS